MKKLNNSPLPWYVVDNTNNSKVVTSTLDPVGMVMAEDDARLILKATAACPPLFAALDRLFVLYDGARHIGDAVEELRDVYKMHKFNPTIKE